MSDFTAKARRAAEWFRAEGWDVRHRDERWRVYSPGYDTGDEAALPEDFAGSDRLLIAFAEDRGWQDQDQQADGVEWHADLETTEVNGCHISIYADGGRFEWSVFKHTGQPEVEIWHDHLNPPTTREEARRQAVEAARGMG